MTTNVGMIDRTLRFVLGGGLIAAALGYWPNVAPQWWGWVGIIPMLTAAYGVCPVYTALGIDTCRRA